MTKSQIREQFDLSGKVALITGASKGIGAAMAHGLAQLGATIAVCSRSQESVDAVAAEIREAGGQAAGFSANVGDMDGLKLLVDSVVDSLGGVDILINNAAANPVFGPILDTELNAFDKIMDVNLKGPYMLCRLVVPIMAKRGGGSIINISSVGGVSPEEGIGIYSVSKAALISLTKALAKEVGGVGIRVNAVCPGLIKTKFSRALWENEKMLDRFVKHLPSKRMGSPEELMGIAAYLASDAGAYSTGGVFMVDGGFTI